MFKMPSGEPLGQFAIVLAGHCMTEQRLFEEGFLTPPPPRDLPTVPDATEGIPPPADFCLNVRDHQSPDFDLSCRPHQFSDSDLNLRRRK